nr:glycosyltransferase [Candidatus Baldrarchaeota archaeon]
MPKVSVILPCYNGARWISEAIESVLNQTFEDFELIVVDDGSTDNSREIVTSYMDDKRVHYIYQKNRGFSAAVNRGLKESKGDLVGFICQDDLWLPDKLKLQVKYLSKHKDVGLVHTSCFDIDSQGRTIRIRNIEMPVVSSKEEFIEKLFLRNFIAFPTVLVKRQCFDQVGFFDEHMVGFSDHDMWLRMAGKFNIGHLSRPLVKKREHEFQLSKVRYIAVLRDEFLLVKKAINRYPFLKRAVPRKLASLYYAWGMTLMQKGKIEEAKQKLFKAIRYQPWKLKTIMAYAVPTLYTLIWNHYIKTSPKIHVVLKWLEY